MAVGQVALRVRRAEAAAPGDTHDSRQPRQPHARRVGGGHSGGRARAAGLPARQGNITKTSLITACVRVCVRSYVRACVRACVHVRARACVRACVRECVC